MPSRSPTPLLLSPSSPQLGAGGEERASFPISSAQTLPGPYSDAQSRRVKEVPRLLHSAWPRKPRAPWAPQPASLRPQARYWLLCAVCQDSLKQEAQFSLGSRGICTPSSTKFACCCVGFFPQTAQLASGSHDFISAPQASLQSGPKREAQKRLSITIWD